MVWSPFRRRPAAMVAAAQPLGPGYARVHRRLRQSWQDRATFFARQMGAIRFAAGITADSGSRCDRIVEKCVDPRTDLWEPVDNDPVAADLLRSYQGRHQTQSELIRQHIWHYRITGEMVHFVEQAEGKAVWSIRSPLAAEWRNDDVLIRDVPGGSERDGTARAIPYKLVKRLWQPNEDWPAYATSPMEGVIRDCERYWSLARMVQRQADSPAAMNGVFWTPNGMHKGNRLNAGQVGPGGNAVPGSKTEKDWYDYARRSFEDDDAIEAVVPPMMWGEHDEGPPQWVRIGAGLDPEGIAHRNEALEAIGRGLDYPQKLFTSGGTDANHWAAWLLEEQFARASVAPILERVYWGDLTQIFFRPGLRALRARGLWSGDPEMYRIGFDMSPIVVHPDQSKQAMELYKLGMLKDTVLLELSGLDASALPERPELARWILRTSVLHPGKANASTGADAASIVSGTPGAGAGVTDSMLPQAAALSEPYLPPVPLALEAPSRVKATVPVGPMPDEELGWLDQ